ncbi:sterol desaturase family protein [bacterium]|nr:sterol desaturase family protein [bacterium]
MDFSKHLVALMIVLAIAEVAVMWMNGKLAKGQAKDAAVNIASSLLDKGMTVAFGLALFAQVYGFTFKYRLFNFDNHSVTAWCAAIIVSDFLYYWYHRVFHRSRFFWTVHAVHHSSELFNFSTALRSSAIVSIVRWPFWLPMPLLGFTPEMTITTYIIVLAYQVWVHTEHIGKLGIIESLLMTPSHHRVHHGSNKQYHDKNYGGILCIWDKMFNSFEPEVEEVKYGVTERMDSSNLLVVNFRDLWRLCRDVVNSRRLSDALGYLFAPPGWKPAENEQIPQLEISELPRSAVPARAKPLSANRGSGVEHVS